MSNEIQSADMARILRLLPHRYPFLMVDAVSEIDGYQSAVGLKNVTANEPHFQGHFPDNPIMPGVTIVEAMGQTAAVMVGVALGMEDRQAGVYFMSIEKCKFRRMVVPGDQLKLLVTTLRGSPKGKVWRFACRGEVDGEMAAEAELTAMIVIPEG
ncbi:MAG: 3-hydroxyacyl-ACP dehydratase FabZ [Pseudomonadota bacterium]